ncbi:SAM-dependent methyltransferase [Actinomadura sp. KC06]|uniref:SAM-dependent methyltransferase n=1 Tax=Actinomadura sp. KC06 TaxID=2530369 RepID=UPI00104DF3A3|nr:SAM-dependent methyltransferase [Actinomadura sp. KC06]TDD34940.1 SAM-dependent methyltransferase [Actinomadura sp. KC06]
MAAVELNVDVPHSARIYDYLLGGKDNYSADRNAAAAIVKASPSLPESMRVNRRYMVRAARYLAKERGIRQFLDIGTGIPTSPNLHEVVQQVAPQSRVVYVDNDPIVLVHARALLNTVPEGAITYIDADLRDVQAILSADELTGTLDLTQPVAVSVIAIFQFIVNEDEAYRIIDALMAPLPAGSALAISTVTAHNPQALSAAQEYTARGIPAKARTNEEVQALFRGLDLVEPGVTLVHRWRPDDEDADVDDAHVQMSGGVAIKTG